MRRAAQPHGPQTLGAVPKSQRGPSYSFGLPRKDNILASPGPQDYSVAAWTQSYHAGNSWGPPPRCVHPLGGVQATITARTAGAFRVSILINHRSTRASCGAHSAQGAARVGAPPAARGGAHRAQGQGPQLWPGAPGVAHRRHARPQRVLRLRRMLLGLRWVQGPLLRAEAAQHLRQGQHCHAGAGGVPHRVLHHRRGHPELRVWLFHLPRQGAWAQPLKTLCDEETLLNECAPCCCCLLLVCPADARHRLSWRACMREGERVITPCPATAPYIVPLA